MNKVIYLVLDKKTGKCLYVGRTANFKQRCRAHELSKRFRKFTLGFRIYKIVPKSTEASAEEKSAILRYRAIGQAQFNKAIPFTFSIDGIVKKIRAMDDFIVCSTNERKFVLDIARAMGVQIITFACKRGFTIHIPSEVTN